MKKKIISILFLISVFFFFLASFVVPDKAFSYNENRSLAQRPELSKESIFDGSYMKNYETYVTDQMLWRDWFVQFSTNIKLMLGQKEVNNVYISNNYLVEKFAETDIDQEVLKENQEHVKEFLANAPNAYFGLIPTAGGVVEGLYPKYSNNLNQQAYIKNIYNYVDSENTFDIFSTLKEHSNEEIYYHTDHHWTTLGSYYGYVAICEQLGITPIPLENFEEVLVTDEFEGTIQSKVNYSIGADKIYKYIPKFDVSYTRVLNEDPKTLTNTLYDESKLETKEKYAVFLGGNNAVVRVKTEGGVEDRGKLLLIKDSYTHCLVPFLANHYSEIVLLDLRHYVGGVNFFIKSNRGFDDIVVLYNLKNFTEAANLFALNR